MAQSSQNDDEQKNSVNKQKRIIPQYRINLELAADKRWEQVINDYKHHFKQIEKVINDLISKELGATGTFLKSIISSTMTTLANCGAVYYKDELTAIANQSNMQLGLLVVMQLIYEASAHCTSIICNDLNGKPIHIRTMDWEMPFLRPMTIEVEFYRNNKPICIATSWAGYVGILTGLRYGPNGFSISVNERETDDGLWENLKQAICGSWPIGFLVRKVLSQKDNINFNSAKSILKNSPLIAPVYFIMSGYNKNEGCLITRDREDNKQFLQLNSKTGAVTDKKKLDTLKYNTGNKDFIIQTNIDHWIDCPTDNVLWSVERRIVACKKLTKINYKATYDMLWGMVTEHPIFNEITVYGTLMSVTDGYLETRVPNKSTGFVINKDNNGEEKMDVEWVTCKKCARVYHDALNVKGECSHIGDWHSDISDCNALECAFGLTINIGKEHWGCCYSVEYNSKCTESGKHEPMLRRLKLGVSGYKCGDDENQEDKSNDSESDSDSDSSNSGSDSDSSSSSSSSSD
eukprot:392972_1